MESNLKNNPFYAAALEFARTHDLKSMTPGKHIIDGDNLYVNIIDAPMKTMAKARFEVHDRYIDLQMPLGVPESFGVKPRTACTKPDGVINTEKDILFYDDPVTEADIVTVPVGEMITFEPDTAHAPNIGPEGNALKAVFKIKVV